MARNIKNSCKICRREGVKLFLKGARCLTPKCAFERRAYAPGQHGKMRRKPSDYGIRLREKQKLRSIYGVLERQFRVYVYTAKKQKGVAGENLLRLLERRLDSVVYRLGMASSRSLARQLVRHGHVVVNDKKVDIPSYLIKENDIISVKEKSRDLGAIKNSIEAAKEIGVPVWLKMDEKNLKGMVIKIPDRKEMAVPIQEQFIIEFY